MKKKLRIDMIVIALLLVIALGWFLLNNVFSTAVTPMAKVQVDGQVVKEIDLNAAEDQTIQIDSGKLPVTLEIKDHKIAFVNAVCPDKICEHYGYIHKSGQEAVCLPAKVSVHIYEK